MPVNGGSRTQTRAKRAYSFGQRQVDRVVSPQTRQRSYDATARFAADRPILFAFIVSQLVFSALPLGLFISFSLSTAVFALVSALVFSAFWIGVALLVLVPVLFVTTSVAILVWLWAVATFLIGRRVYQSIAASQQGGVQLQMPSGKQVIFQKGRNGGPGVDLNGVDIKEEAAEIKE